MSRFHPERLVVIGEGLAAGFGPFSLQRMSQRFSFPSLIARQLGVAFSQPLLEPPGVGNAPGFEPQPVILPGVAQSTVFDQLPPVEFANLSIPEWTLADALERRPCQPLIQRDDARQTVCNLILGARRIATNGELLTQVESAAQRQATGVLVALGFTEALTAAIHGDVIHGDVMKLPSAEQFGEMYSRLAAALAPATLLLLTVPDPFDTPFFQKSHDASRVLRVEETWLQDRYGVGGDEYLKVPAVHEIGFQIFGKSYTPLLPHARVAGGIARTISARVAEWNSQIRNVAAACGADVYDLHSLTKRLRTDGITVGTRHLTGDYLGGLYSLNGYYLGHTAHGVVANEILSMLGQPTLDLRELLKNDPSADIEPARGRLWRANELSEFPTISPEPAMLGRPVRSAGIPPLKGLSYEPLATPLKLPSGLKQELPLDHHGSYFGDGIAANHCEDPIDAQFGDGGHLLFGGLAMVDSHLKGMLRFEFTPLTDTRASFTLHFTDLEGDDAVLVTPILFRMAFQKCGVSAYPNPQLISSGVVDLTTGDVSKLRVFASFRAVALQTLVGCNKNFPSTPLSFLTLDVAASPLEYSSAWARFDQRADGKLDFVFYGSRFVPLGPGAKWPLNFSGPDGDVTMIPASGTVMHPHLRLCTRTATPEPQSGRPSLLPLPENCIREFTFHTHNTAFGDGFDLRVSELGGPVTGRAHVLGRASVQFGLPSGGTIPVAIRNLLPGGIFSQPPLSPIADSFPARVGPGPRGFNQRLRYPRATLTMEEISIPDDPFDIALGAVDVETGFLFSEHLHRGFIQQDVINALMRIEPRVRHTSFFFRGPGVFALTRSNALMFRFFGDEILAYPAGLAYPQPDFTSSFYAGLGATLNPYFWIRAIEDTSSRDCVAEGSYQNVTAASGGDLFSFDYRIPANPGKSDFYFRFRNASQLGAFELHGLSWVGFGNNAATVATGKNYDTLTFSGFGVWEKNTVKSIEQIAVQIWTNPDNPKMPYIGIQIASGVVSNLDTRPVDPNDAHP